MTKEELKQAVEQMVDEVLSKEETVEKAVRPKEKEEANSGAPGKPEDKIKSGTPKMQEKKELTVKKSEEEEKSEETVIEKAKDEKQDEKKEDLKKKCMKKSDSEDQQEILEIDDEELELIKAWRQAKDVQDEEPVSKSVEATEDLAKSVKEENDNLKKSLSEQAELIKSLSDKVEKLASQPAYDKRSISTLEPIEKSESATQDISKAQVLEKMLELQMSGKGVKSTHVSEFEATSNISDPSVKAMVMNAFKQ